MSLRWGADDDDLAKGMRSEAGGYSEDELRKEQSSRFKAKGKAGISRNKSAASAAKERHSAANLAHGVNLVSSIAQGAAMGMGAGKGAKSSDKLASIGDAQKGGGAGATLNVSKGADALSPATMGSSRAAIGTEEYAKQASQQNRLLKTMGRKYKGRGTAMSDAELNYYGLK